ncbi:MAG TPA: VanZ family protein [Clostridiales bacterium]|nr:VanZ family protein [Clostridiales bacterium]
MIIEKKKTVCLILFIVYILIVLKLTIFRFAVNYDEPQLNLTFFTDLIYVYKNAGVIEFLRLFLGNIGWFIPFGFLLPMLLKKKSVLKVAILGLVFSFSIEVSQFIFRKGIAELDDLVLNTLGAVIGYILYTIIINRGGGN